LLPCFYLSGGERAARKIDLLLVFASGEVKGQQGKMRLVA
jgi:hypothetical protein